jgi:hypothetical protein
MVTGCSIAVAYILQFVVRVKENEIPHSKSYGVSRTSRNEASFGEYHPKRFKTP